MKKRFTLLLVLAATFLMFMPVKVYAEPNPDSTEWAMLKKAVEFEIDDSLAEVFELTITDGNTRTIKLLKNITAEEDDSVMTVPNGKTVTLNLNGFTLDRGLSEASEPVENGHLLDVDGGVLNITGKGKIRGGNEFYDGGAIYNAGTLNISGEITICDNKARRYGGAIYNVGNLNIGVGTTICDNEAHDGGAICNDMGGRVEAMASTFDNNTCDGCGGAIYNTDLVEVNYVNLVNCNLSNNRAQSGGAIYTKDIVKFTGTDFLWGTIGIIDSCTANEYGGAVYINGDGRFEMSGGKITNCSAKSGGAIYVSNGAEILRGTAQLTNLTIEDCEATENDGGGILSHGAIGLDGVTVSGNRAKKKRWRYLS